MTEQADEKPQVAALALAALAVGALALFLGGAGYGPPVPQLVGITGVVLSIGGTVRTPAPGRYLALLGGVAATIGLVLMFT